MNQHHVFLTHSFEVFYTTSEVGKQKRKVNWFSQDQLGSQEKKAGAEFRSFEPTIWYIENCTNTTLLSFVTIKIQLELV